MHQSLSTGYPFLLYAIRACVEMILQLRMRGIINQDPLARDVIRGGIRDVHGEVDDVGDACEPDAKEIQRAHAADEQVLLDLRELHDAFDDRHPFWLGFFSSSFLLGLAEIGYVQC